MTSFTTRPSRDPGPVYVTFDVYRGGRSRSRKWFASGVGRAAKAFYLAKAREGRNPRVVRADDGPDLFSIPMGTNEA
jgi:hypothetical protein